MGYNPNTYGWYQCDEEDYDSGTPPEEQTATAPIQDEEQGRKRDGLLVEYRTVAKVADDYWKEYSETGSSQAFGNYLAANRQLSLVYVELVGMGMTLGEIRGE